MERKKVAFCYSGCFRNFQDQVEQHLEFSNSLLEKWGIEADIYRFACFWEFNQLTGNWDKEKLRKYLQQNGITDFSEEAHRYPSKVNVPVRAEDVDRVMSDPRYNWVSYKFEPFQVYLNVLKHYPFSVSCMISPHYAMKQVMALRRKYEQQNNLYFDIVVWLRSDKKYGVEDGELLPLPEKNKLEVFGWGIPLPTLAVHRKANLVAKGFMDMFFYGNSHSVDVAANCYSEPIEDLKFSEIQDGSKRGDYYPIEEHFYNTLTENGIGIRYVPVGIADWGEWQTQYFKLKKEKNVLV